MKNIKQTVAACYIGYISQAIINNFSPLLYVTFRETYGISLSEISLLIVLNFGIQVLVDFTAARFIGDSNTRSATVLAHAFAAVGLIGLFLFPKIIPNAFLGICIAVIMSGVGGGLIEVMVSPILEALPGDEKSGAMSLLHSFYCWGQAGVILISTLVFTVGGISLWPYLAISWAAVPLAGMILFSFAPIYPLVSEGESMPRKKLFTSRLFWILLIMMLCAGASELAMSQWASAFVEKGLGIDKSMGDLLGPCMFAVLMGISRVFYAKFSKKIDLRKFFIISSLICMASYLLAAISPHPIVSLVGCALCGFGVGVMWPGTYSIAAAALPGGGVSMFAYLALAGDIGCTSGPSIVGLVADAAGGNLRIAFLVALVFPSLLLISQKFIKTESDKNGNKGTQK